MTFLAPIFLAALLAIAIPIIIHLLNFRKPKRIAFSTLSFFKELQQSTIRRLKIKRFLLLLLRGLAVLALVLALARPFLQSTTGAYTGSAPVLYGILIENGIGMTRIDAQGPYIDQARELAGAIVDRAREQDRFMVFNTHGELVRGGILTPAQARLAIAGIEAGARGSQLRNRYEALFRAMDEWSGGGQSMYWVTTGSTGGADQLIGADVNNARVPLNVVKLGSARLSNTVVSIVTTVGAVTGSGRPFNLEVEISNLGTESALNHFVSLEAENELIGQYQADLEPGQSRSFVFEVVPGSAGDLTGRVILEGDAFSQDNIHYFSVNVPESRSVLLVRDGDSSESYLQSVLRAGEQTGRQIRLEIKTMNELATTANPDQYDAIVLDSPVTIPEGVQELLQRYVQAGNGLVFYPSEKGSINAYNRFLSRFNSGEITGFTGEFASFNAITRLATISEGHPVLDTVFEKQESDEIRVTLPSLYYYLRYQAGGNASGLTILRSELGDPLLVEQRFGNGRVMVNFLGATPGWSAMPGSPLFAPLAYRTVLYAASTGTGGMFNHTLGEPFNEQLLLAEPLVDIRNIETESVYRVNVQPTVSGPGTVHYDAIEWSPGIYEISDNTHTRSFSVNLDVSESDFRSLDTQQLETLLKDQLYLGSVFEAAEQSIEDVKSEIGSAGFGSEIWNVFILLAFLFLVAESIVSRWYKAETIS